LECHESKDVEVPMTPFQMLRRWFRRAPLPQKASSVAAVVLALSALMWAVVPAGSQTTSGLGLTGSARPVPTTTSTSPTVAGLGSTTSTSTTIAGGSPSAATGTGSSVTSTSVVTGAAPVAGSTSGHCDSPAGSAPGVTATQIKVAVLLVNIAGAAADSTFGIASPATQQAAFQAVINNVNANGGVACRKLVPQYFTEDPIDQSALQQACLTITQSNVFAVLDPGAYANYAAGLDCYAQDHMPYFEGYQLDGSQVAHDYPFLFSLGSLNVSYEDSVMALKQLGFFSPANGFKKLGLIYRNCFPDLVSDEMSWLNQAGVPSSDISSYDMGCPSAFASPSDLENAVLQFKEAGVTNMTEVNELGDMANFTNIAQAQGFGPKWGLADDGLFEISNGSEAPNAQELNGAVGISASRNGENNTSALSSHPTAGTQKCSVIMEAAGLGSVYSQPAAVGNACDQVWMLQAALDNAPELSQEALAAGLQRAGSIDFSYPQGPNNFTATGTMYGGQFWRQDTYTTAGGCDCWQVVNPNWSPSY
jgi:Periplasmic binding protein